AYGSGRSRTDWTIVKSALLAPMQSASVMIAVAAKPRSLKSTRKANFRSWRKVSIVWLESNQVYTGPIDLIGSCACAQGQIRTRGDSSFGMLYPRDVEKGLGGMRHLAPP